MYFGNSNDWHMKRKKNETVFLKRGGQTLPLDYQKLRKAALVLRALNHKLRRRIIELLESEGPLTVTDIYIKLRLEQSVASQHLAIIRRVKVVNTKRDGKYIYYSLNRERIEQIADLVAKLAGGDEEE